MDFQSNGDFIDNFMGQRSFVVMESPTQYEVDEQQQQQMRYFQGHQVSVSANAQLPGIEPSHINFNQLLPTPPAETDAGDKHRSGEAPKNPKSKASGRRESLKKDDPEPACRPRLSPQETTFLESNFMTNNRPSTNQKKAFADQLGLPVEKINNWFQNRRAKQKQQYKNQPQLAVMGTCHGAAQFNAMPPVAYAQHNGVVASGPVASTIPAGFPLQDQFPSGNMGVAPMSNWFTGGESSNLALMESMSHMAQEAYAVNAQFPVSEGLSSKTEFTDVPFGDFDPNMQMGWLGDSGAAAGLSSQLPQSELPSTNAISGSANLTFQGEPAWGDVFSSVSQGSGNGGDIGLDLSSASLIRDGTEGSTDGTEVTLTPPQETPSPEDYSQASSGANADDEQRRASETSELANNLNTIDLKKSNDDDVFKVPKVPASNLAARRKCKRPANLIAMRSASPPTSDLSPTGNFVLPNSLRKIQSMNNGLNVRSGRVQKSVPKSPLAASLQQSIAESAGNFASQPLERSITSAPMDHITSVPTSSSMDNMNGFWPVSPSDASMPPLSATLTQHSHDEPSSYVGTPVTPFHSHIPNFYNGSPLRNSDVPLSAPANVTVFPMNSLPEESGASGYSMTQSFDLSLMPTADVGFSNNSQVYGVRLNDPIHGGIGQPKSSVTGPSATGNAAAPSRELQIQIAEFPKPKIPHEVYNAHTNHPLSFQHHSPNDYNNKKGK